MLVESRIVVHVSLFRHTPVSQHQSCGMAAQDDITTFSGFGSWMSTFTPESSQKTHHVSELEASYPISKVNTPVELAADNYPAPYDPSNHHYIPVPAPVPMPTPSPVPPPVDNRRDVPLVRPLEKYDPVIQDKPDPITRVQVNGLQKAGQRGNFQDAISTSTYSFLDDINSKLASIGMSRLPRFCIR